MTTLFNNHHVWRKTCRLILWLLVLLLPGPPLPHNRPEGLNPGWVGWVIYFRISYAQFFLPSLKETVLVIVSNFGKILLFSWLVLSRLSCIFSRTCKGSREGLFSICFANDRRFKLVCRWWDVLRSELFFTIMKCKINFRLYKKVFKILSYGESL